MCTHTPRGGWRPGYNSVVLAFPAFMWVPVIKLRWPGSCGKCFYLLSCSVHAALLFIAISPGFVFASLNKNYSSQSVLVSLCCEARGQELRSNWVSSLLILEIIDDLANLVENTDEKLRTEARRVTLVDRKSASCGKRWQAFQLPAAVLPVLHVPTDSARRRLAFQCSRPNWWSIKIAKRCLSLI